MSAWVVDERGTGESLSTGDMTTIATSAPRLTRVQRAEQEAADIGWLTGTEGLAALEAVVRSAGATLVSAVVHEVHHRPGAGVTVGFDARVATAADPLERAEYILLTTGQVEVPASPASGIVRLQNGERVLHAWKHPADPALPGLPIASDVTRAAARTRLDEDPGTAVLELIGYRPMRRAVLSLTSQRRRVFLKVVRPDQLDGLLARNRYAEPAGAPPVLDVWDESVLVFPQAQGEPLPELLARDGAASVDPRDLLTCLDSIHPDAVTLPLRRPWAERSAHYADAACNVLPDQADRIRHLESRIASLIERFPRGPVVPTHGDFHAANILMTGAAVTALLDVDTIGPGQRVDDLACLLGHMAVLPCLAPQTYPLVPTTLRRWMSVFDSAVHPGALRVRAAGVVLSLLASMPANDTSEAARADALGRLAVAEQLLSEVRD